MRTIIQRVKRAHVKVDDKIVGKINRGLCVLVGIQSDDTQDDLDYIVKKILNIRLFSDPANDKAWSKSVVDLGLEILSVSQFTLYAQTNKGSKPDFHRAMKSEESAKFYQTFLHSIRSQYQTEKIQDGLFGAMMEVEIVNDGPVTITLDSRAR